MSILTETGIKSLVCLVSPWGMGLFSMVVSGWEVLKKGIQKLDSFLPKNRCNSKFKVPILQVLLLFQIYLIFVFLPRKLGKQYCHTVH